MSDPAYVDYQDYRHLHYEADDFTDEDPVDCRGEAAAVTTSLDPSQSTVIQVVPVTTGDEAIRSDVAYRFRKLEHAHAFDRTLAVLQAHHRHEKRARRLSLCGAHATIWHSPSTDRVTARSYHCGLRCCPRCRETHAAKTKETLSRFIGAIPRHKISMITLTMTHSQQPLTEQLDHLYASFRRLRQSAVWKEAKPRGYAVLEMTRNAERNEWHPHLHLLAEAPYIRHDRLRDAWTAATYGATIIHIARVNRRAIEHTQQYLTDYLTKIPAPAILDQPAILTEWIDSLTHRKVLLRFGNPPLLPKPKAPADPGDWSLIGSMLGILAGVARQNKRAIYWLTRLTRGPVHEQRDPDAGKDYSLSSDYRSPTEQFF